MKRRLVTGYSVVTVVGILVALLLAMPLVDHIYKHEVEERLSAVLILSQDALAQDALEGKNGDEEMDALLSRWSSALSKRSQPIRLTLIDVDGRVLADSLPDEERYESHAQRPEVVNALAGNTGRDIRQSRVSGQRMMYLAVPIEGGRVLRAALPMSRVAQAQLQLLLCAAGGLLVGALLSILMALAVSAQVLRPVEQLTVAAEAMAEGDWSRRVIPSDDELGKMARTFNDMALRQSSTMRALAQSRSQLEGVIEGMEDGVLAVDREGYLLLCNPRARQMLPEEALVLNEKLPEDDPLAQWMKDAIARITITGEPMREERTFGPHTYTLYAALLYLPSGVGGTVLVLSDITRLRKLEHLRQEFVANVTHELKTPLTVIRGYTELLMGGPEDMQARRKFYEIIDIEAERLHALIDDMLNLSEIEQGQEMLRNQECDVHQAVERSFAALEKIGQEAEVQLINRVPPGLTMHADQQRIGQILDNLVTNAIRYNVPGGQVRISAEKERGMIEIRVEDTGVGIAQEHLPRLFERFYRVDKSRSRQHGGTGLGLSIVKHIAQRYGGDVEVQSEEGKGSTFIVRMVA